MSITPLNKFPLRMREPTQPLIENCIFHDEPDPANKPFYKKKFYDLDKKPNWKAKRDNVKEMENDQMKSLQIKTRIPPVKP